MSFWFVAALLALGATATVVVPLLRNRTETASAVSAAILVFTVPLGAVLMYVLVSSNPANQEAGGAMPPVEEMISGLAERLASQPDDLEGWLMLGRSYIAVGRYQEAVTTFQRAMELTGGGDPQAMLGYAEALILTDRTSVSGEAGDLVESVLKSFPDNPRALWYGGLVAAARQDTAAAAERWRRLLSTDPEPQVREFLEQQLAAMGQPPAGDSPQEVLASEPPAGPRLQINVSLAPELADNVPRGAPVFVIARDADMPAGPPIAVTRNANYELPAVFELTDANAMVPGRSLSQPARLRVIARISASGGATAGPGDLFGEAIVEPASLMKLSLEIDQFVN